MPDPLTLIVLVAAGEASAGATRSMVTAAHDALGADARVLLREASGTSAAPDDAQALASERETNADAVVELRWGDSLHRHATVRMHVARSARWIERQVTFRKSDADAERGRTLGFSIASIFPESSVAGHGGASQPAAAQNGASPVGAQDAGPNAGPGTAPTNPRQTSAAPDNAIPSAGVLPSDGQTAPNATASDGTASNASASSATAPSGAPIGGGATTPAAPNRVASSAPNPKAVASQGPPGTSPAIATGPPAPNTATDILGESPRGARADTGRWALELSLAGAVDSVEYNAGGAAVLEVSLGAGVQLRGGCSVRVGRVDPVEGATLVVTPELGLAMALVPASVTRSMALGLRVGVLVQYESLQHLPGAAFAQTHDGLNGGGDVVLDASWSFSRRIDGVLGVGAEGLLYSRDIYVDKVFTTTLPVIHGVGEAGVRWRF